MCSFDYFFMPFFFALPLKGPARPLNPFLSSSSIEAASVGKCRGLPREFMAYFDHIHSSSFNDTPKYSYLRRIFHDLFIRKGFEYDHVVDWTILEYLRATQ